MHVDILEPDLDLNKAMDALGRVLNPTLHKAWEAKRKSYEDKPFDFNVAVFTQLWLQKDLKVFIAYDENNGNEVLGFMTGLVYRPIQYNARVFQVQDWYTGDNIEVEKALFKYLTEAVKFLGADEILVSNSDGDSFPEIPGNWKLATTSRTKRYIRKQ